MMMIIIIIIQTITLLIIIIIIGDKSMDGKCDTEKAICVTV